MKKLIVLLLMCSWAIWSNAQQVYEVTYLEKNRQVVKAAMVQAEVELLLPINIIEKKAVAAKVNESRVQAIVGAVTWWDGKATKVDPGFSAIWFDGKLRVYAWRDFKELVEVTDSVIGFEKI